MTDFDTMPTTYETKTTTTTTTSTEQTRQEAPPIGFNKAYLTSIYGLLKLGVMVLSMVTFICAAVGNPFWGPVGGYWAEFVAMSAFISATIMFILYLLSIAYRIHPIWLLIHFIYDAVYCLLFIITGIVASARTIYPRAEGSATATSIFCFATAIVLAADTFFQFRNWRSGTDTYVTRTQQQTETTTAEEAQY